MPGHDAFSLAPVVSNLDDKLTCMTYNGDDIYIGTASGRLLLYRVRASPSGPRGKVEYSASRVAAVDVLSGGAISAAAGAPRSTGSTATAVTQLEAIPDLNLLVVLCDGGLALFDADSLRKRAAGVLDTKFVLSFALNTRGPPKHKLCVVSSKKRLRLYQWEAGKYVFLKDLDLPDIPRAVVYYGNRLACGYQREYNVLEEESGEVRDVTGMMSRDTRPLIKHLPPVVVRQADWTGAASAVASSSRGPSSTLSASGASDGSPSLTTVTSSTDNLLIITADDVGVVLNADGEPATISGPRHTQVGIPALQFGHHPLSIGFCYPYIISVGDGGSGGGSSGKVEVHATRGRRDELVQRLDLPSGGAVCLADGRVGVVSRSGVDFTDAAKGRNPVYVATGSPGQVFRLQPVPVDSQVEQMLRQGAVAAAQELLLNTAPPNVLRTKIDRLNIDAGRSLFFSLQFEAAFAHLAASELDPRELIAMMPELQLSAPAVAAALAGEEGALSVVTLARAYRYPSRYFSASLTNAIANGQRTAADAASEAADVPPSAAAAAGGELDAAIESLAAAVSGRAHISAEIPSPASASTPSGAAGLSTGVADAASLIAACVPAFVSASSAANDTSHTRNDRSRGVHQTPNAAANAAAAADRVAVLMRCTQSFLRQRRREIARVREAMTLAAAAAASGSAESHTQEWSSTASGAHAVGGNRVHTLNNSSNSTEDDTDSALLTLVHMTPSGKRRHAAGSAFPASLRTASEADFDALALAVDTALFKCLAATDRWDAVDRLLSRPTALDLTDATRFLRERGKYHSLGILLRTRKLGEAALSLWRELGTGKLVEVRSSPHSTDAKQQRRRTASTFGGMASDDEENSENEEGNNTRGSMDGSNGTFGKGTSGWHGRRTRRRIDSLSDVEDVQPAMTVFNNSYSSSTTNSNTHFSSHANPNITNTTRTQYDGVEDTVSYLCAETDEKLIFTFAEWVLLSHPVVGLRIFTESQRVPPLSPDAILRFLAAAPFATAAAHNPASGVLRLYLEHLVLRLGRDEEPFHTALAREYIAVVLRLRENDAFAGESSATTSPAALALDLETKRAGPARDRPPPGTEGGLLGDTRTRLLRLLQESQQYNARTLSGIIARTSLYEERVIIHARLGEHAAALQLLVFSLADSARAVRYAALLSAANRLGMADSSVNPTSTTGSSIPPATSTPSTALYDAIGDIDGDTNEEVQAVVGNDPFLLLLRLYLDADRVERLRRSRATANVVTQQAQPQQGAPPSSPSVYTVYLDRALDLLSHHATRIDPFAVARLLPPDLPLARVAQYWTRSIPASAHGLREAALTKHLFNFTYISTHAALVSRQAIPTMVTRAATCFVCDKQLGDSVIAVLPGSRRCVHFHCLPLAGLPPAPAASGYGAQLLGLHATPQTGTVTGDENMDADTALAAAHGVLYVYLLEGAPQSAPAAGNSYAAAKGWLQSPDREEGHNSSTSSPQATSLPLALLLPHVEGSVGDARQYLRTATVAPARHGTGATNRYGMPTSHLANVPGFAPAAAVVGGAAAAVGGAAVVVGGAAVAVGSTLASLPRAAMSHIAAPAVSAVERTVGSAIHTAAALPRYAASAAVSVGAPHTRHGRVAFDPGRVSSTPAAAEARVLEGVKGGLDGLVVTSEYYGSAGVTAGDEEAETGNKSLRAAAARNALAPKIVGGAAASNNSGSANTDGGRGYGSASGNPFR